MNKTEKFWDRIAKQWDTGDYELDEISIKAIKKTKKHLSKDDILLEFGCGHGIISNELADSVKEVQGIDISAKMIDLAKRITDERNIENVAYKQATIFDEDLDEGSFSVITAFNILHLLDDLPEVTHRINGLLKPGDIFISTTACLGQKRSFLGVFLSLLNRVGLVPNLKMLTIPELEEAIVSGGFEIVDTEILQQSPMNYFIVAKKL